MMKRTGLVLLGVLHSALLWGAAESGHSTANFWYVLRRIVNPTPRFVDGGTHNSVHFSCENRGKFSHGFLDPGQDHDDIGVPIPVEESNAILLSVAKHRFALFQAQSKNLVLRKFDKGNTGKFTDHVLAVENLPQFLDGECPIVVEILHGGKIACKHNQAGLSKSTNRAMSSPVIMHAPPKANESRMSHEFGCPCPDCVNQLSSPLPFQVQTLPEACRSRLPASHARKQLPAPPSYPAPTQQRLSPPSPLYTPSEYPCNPFSFNK